MVYTTSSLCSDFKVSPQSAGHDLNLQNNFPSVQIINWYEGTVLYAQHQSVKIIDRAQKAKISI